MGNEKSAELRNPSQARRGAIRNGDPLQFEEFLKKWRQSLRRPSPDWDGPRAVAELQRREMFQFLLYEEQRGWQANDLFTRILDEMRAYRREASDRIAKEHFDTVERFLNGLSEKIRKREDATAIPRLRALLSRLRRDVETAEKTARRFRQEAKDGNFGIWRKLWPEVRRENLVERKIELDTRLQVEMGKMFADHLRPKERPNRVGLETIARLILLAYLVGRLAFRDESGILIYGTRRKLSVRNIRENLRHAGVHKAASFRGKRRRKRSTLS